MIYLLWDALDGLLYQDEMKHRSNVILRWLVAHGILRMPDYGS